jgi:anti-anti-sigma factor
MENRFRTWNRSPGQFVFSCEARTIVITTHIETSRIGNLVVVGVNGPIRAGDSELAFVDAIEEILREGDLQVLLDLSCVPHVDSTGLGRILQAACRFQRAGGALTLLRPSSYVRDLLVITKVMGMVPVVDSVDAAAEFPPAACYGPA